MTATPELLILEQNRIQKSKWSKEVKRLCNNRCVNCGATDGGTRTTRLESHHFFMREEYSELADVLENGVCLCHACHYAVHAGDYTKFGQIKSTVYPNNRYSNIKTNEARKNVENYIGSHVILTFSKEKYEALKAHAAARGETVNGFINRAIDEAMERDGRENDG